MDIQSKILFPLFGFVLTIAFGLWLSRKGKPYHGLLFNVHKLIALGTVILAAMRGYQMLTNAEPQAVGIFLLLLAALCVIALFVSGALMSAGKGEYKMMKLVHHLAPVFGILGMAGAVYLFL